MPGVVMMMRRRRMEGLRGGVGGMLTVQ